MMKKMFQVSPETTLRRNSPEPLADRIQKKAKLIIIDDERNYVRLMSVIVSKVCHVPLNLPQVKSYEQAAHLVEMHNPDIVICDKSFGQEGDHFRVLEFTKSRNKDAKIILFSGYANEDDTIPMNGFSFDCVISKGSVGNEDIIKLVKMFSKKE